MLWKYITLSLICSLGCTSQQLIRIPIQQRHHDPILSKRQSITAVPLLNANSREYLIEVSIGTPSQKFNLTLDTGSSDVWINSSKCSKSNCPSARFSESNSNTLNQTNRSFQVQYGRGSAKGTVAYDTIAIGQLSCPSQPLGLATSTNDLSSMRSSGILGLAFPSLMRYPDQDIQFILNLVKNKLIGEPVFSIYLNRQQADNVSYTGEIVMGGYETSRFTGSIQFLPLVSYHQQTGQPLIGHTYSSTQGIYRYWTVPGQAVACRDKDNRLIYETQLPDIEPAILDTGTTLSYMPQDTVLTLLKLITTDYKERKTTSGSIVYEVNCSDFSAQDRWFDFMFSTRLEGFSSNPVTIRVPLVEMALAQEESCLFGIAPISTGFLSSVGSGWILGQTVLRSAYVVHDMVGCQVGIGAASNGYESPTMDQSSSNAFHHQPSYLLCITCLCLILLRKFSIVLQ